MQYEGGIFYKMNNFLIETFFIRHLSEQVLKFDIQESYKFTTN